ncbi:e57095f0-caa0-494a-8862-13489ddd9ee7 [Thermothielavioides terrestris]|uniref:E57095f0-caa0-494a-8862-13489ddd9ee7 n=1 Tax=Thermothielavioides terrestris TaxID=2587410 RepID=A0A446BUB5_9PEZI|nr:e57095f0-caa0-494a-8862-13489ddd9ee7 [Thermothielavioides terrestris]
MAPLRCINAPATASLFVQLSMRRQAISSGLSIFDILLPSPTHAAAAATARLSEIMAKDSNPHLALRIEVESGGCHGFQYLMKLVTLPPSLPVSDSSAPAAEEDSESAVIREDDTIFAFTPEGSTSPGDLTAPKIILDLPSLEILKGSKVDFTMELIGSQFKIVDNPLATSSCGCGTSFDIKI